MQGDGTFDRAQSFVFDGTNVVLVLDNSDSLSNRYLWGPAVDQLFADEDAVGEMYWALADNQGTIRDVADYDAGTDTTTVVNHIEYDSFGNVTAESDANKSLLFQYTGRYWDDDANLQWNNARWYDPATGRWLSEDTLGFTAGDANLSRYVANSATNATDPSGLEGEGIDFRFGDGREVHIDAGRIWQIADYIRRREDYPSRVSTPEQDRAVVLWELRRIEEWRQYFEEAYRQELARRQREWMRWQEENRRVMEELDQGRIDWDREHCVRNAMLAGFLEYGRAVSYPMRWVGVDFSDGDRALEDLWREGTYSHGTAAQAWSRGAAQWGAIAFWSAVGAAGWSRAGLPTGGIGVGRVAGQRAPHIIFGAGRGGQIAWYHQVGLGPSVVGASSEFTAGAVTITEIPIFFPAAVASTQPGRNCLSTGLRGIGRSWTGGFGR